MTWVWIPRLHLFIQWNTLQVQRHKDDSVTDPATRLLTARSRRAKHWQTVMWQCGECPSWTVVIPAGLGSDQGRLSKEVAPELQWNNADSGLNLLLFPSQVHNAEPAPLPRHHPPRFTVQCRCLPLGEVWTLNSFAYCQKLPQSLLACHSTLRKKAPNCFSPTF